MESNQPDTLELTRRYFAALSIGATGDVLSAFYHPDVVLEEFPNRLNPQGAKRDLANILEAAERGQELMRAQKYEVLHAVAYGNRVAVEFRWTGTLAVPLGSLVAGAEIR